MTKIYCDTSNLKDIKYSIKKFKIDGVTTNPSIMRNEGVKDYKNQFNVLRDVISQIKHGSDSIFGVMIESNLNEGKQKLPKDVESLSSNEVSNQLKYGVSITDCCVSITETKEMLDFVYENL